MIPRAAALLLATGLLVATVAAHAAEWEKVSDKAGVLVERRAVPGSSLYVLRATARSSLRPAAVFATLWAHREYPQFVPHLKRLDILSDTGNERVTYEQVTARLMSDRDYTVRIRKRTDALAQRYEIRFASANDAGPPPNGDHVRVTNIRGGWSVEPDIGGNGSVVRYDVQADPGGAIPAWITNQAQRRAVADLMRSVLKRTLENNSRNGSDPPL